MSETSTPLHAYGVDDDVGAQSQSCSRRGSLQSNATGSLLASSEDLEKARFWRATIREATGSGVSVREFCRKRKLRECQFYWWQRRLSLVRHALRSPKRTSAPASFALVSDEPGTNDAGIELVLAGGRRLRIAKRVDETTLRAVLAAVEPEGC